MKTFSSEKDVDLTFMDSVQ